MLHLGTKGNTHPQKLMQIYAKCLHNYEKMKWIKSLCGNFLKLMGSQKQRMFLYAVCHLLKEPIMTHQATHIN